MRNLHNLGIPDLPERAFQPVGGRIQPQGGKGGSAPKTPDYTAAAEATSQGNLDLAKYTTQANRINQYTPWGSLTYTNDRQFDQAGYDAAMAAYNRQPQQTAQSQMTQTGQRPFIVNGGDAYVNAWTDAGGDAGGSWSRVPAGGMSGGSSSQQMSAPNRDDFWSGGDNWSQHVQLSPEMQAQLDQQNAIQAGLFAPQNAALGRVQDMMSSGFDMSGLSGGGSVYDPNMQTNNATELLMERLNPQLDRQREALRAQLANQGIAQGSSAYNNAMDQHGQTANDAYTQASLHGIGLGMQQQGMQFGQSEQLRQRELAEQSYLRNLPLQELQMLMGGGQVQMPQFPGFAQQAQTAGPDHLGAAQQQYQSQLGAWNAEQAAGSNMFSGLLGAGALAIGTGGLGGLFGGAAPAGVTPGVNWLHSDRRLKRNIKAIGKADNGLTIYSYQYVTGGPTQLGYMADEVQKVAPHAVGERDGYLTVDYSKV